MGGKKKAKEPSRIVAQNRRARHDYEIIEEIEAGVILLGTEVKSMREGTVNLADSHADIQGEDIVLVNAYIAPYKQASEKLNHEPNRPRKLLLHRREIIKLIGKVQKKGFTLIALDIHWNNKGKAKIKLGLCRGKSKYDKRQSEKERDWKMQKARVVRGED